MESTMQDRPLLISDILRQGAQVHGDSRVVTFEGESAASVSFTDVAGRVARLAHALTRLGVEAGDRVGTFGWNNQQHLEAYYAVPSMGAVLHTLNIRLFPDQLAYVVNHAQDRFVLVDASVIPLLARVRDTLETVEGFIVVGDGDTSALEPNVHSYEELIADESDSFDWPELDERSAAAMCYTSGTTGNPKGVVYSHRSTYLHALAECAAGSIGIEHTDRVLAIVPMFHAMAWGLPYSAWMAGADLIFPDRFLQAEPLAQLIESERPTLAGAVPTIWNDLLAHGDEADIDLGSFRKVIVGGSAVPRSLIDAYEDRYGVRIVQAWGMTETSPLGAVANPPKNASAAADRDYRAMTGRVVAGVDLRIVADDGSELPWDGESVGEFQVRGPWITAGYFGDDDPAKFDRGWLRTGDVGYVTPDGFMQITDRAKDVIKSGGEWISSVELENTVMGHDDVLEAAVIGIPDERWDERPLVCVTLKAGAGTTPQILRDWLADKVAKWWIPENWAIVEEIPRTSVGKFDKKVLRVQHEKGELDVSRP